MRFSVTRTEDWADEPERPCPDDRLTRASAGDPWVIELSTLEELVEFCCHLRG